MKRILLVGLYVFLTTSVTCIQAQDYTSATIYTRTFDTIVCQLKVQKSYTAIGNFHYLLEGDKKERKIYKDDIKQLVVGNDVYQFLSIHYKYSAGVETKIYQVLLEGTLTLYAQTYVQTQTLSPGGQLRGTGETYQEFFLKKEGIEAIKEISRIGFKKKILKYVDHCDALSLKIRNKEYGFDDLKKIVIEYNAWYALKHP